MRTLDPVLQAAMDSGNFTPIVRAAVLDPDDHSVEQYLDLVSYKINGLDIEIEFYDPSGTFSDSVSLERGAKVGGIEYTIFSGIYHLTNSFKVKGGKNGLYSCKGSLIEPAAVNVAADVAYSTVISNVLALGTNVASYKDAFAAWKGYQFLAIGQFFHTTNIYTFFTILRQKYLIYAAENGPGSILFFSAADSLGIASQYTLTLTDRDTFAISSNHRQFIWKDEAGSLHQPGPATYPIHNLGYLESSASAPVVPENNFPLDGTVLTVIPNLKYQSGDCVQFDPGIGGYALVKSVLDVTERYDSTGKSPAWRMELRPLRYFSPTEAGQVDRSEQYTTSYAPLASSGFTGLLDNHVTNLQALADAVDDLPVARLDAQNVFTAGQSIAVATATYTGLRIKTTDENTAHHVLELVGQWDNVVSFFDAHGNFGIGIPAFTYGGAVMEMLSASATVAVFRGSYTSTNVIVVNENDPGRADWWYASTKLGISVNHGSPGWVEINEGDAGDNRGLIFQNNAAGVVGIGQTSPYPGAKLHVKTSNAALIGLIVQGAASQTEDLFELRDSSDNVFVKAAANGVFFPLQKATASAPTYVKGGMYFDLTLKKLRIGGASAWETVTSV